MLTALTSYLSLLKPLSGNRNAVLVMIIDCVLHKAVFIV